MKRIRHILATIGVALVTQSAVAQPYFDWVESAGGTGASCSMPGIADNANRNYAVEVTQNGCTDTSTCVNVTGVGIGETHDQPSVRVFPNPTSGYFTINYFNNGNQRVDLSVMDVAGKQMGSWSFVNTMELDFSGYAKGVYYLQFKTKESIVTHKLLLQ